MFRLVVATETHEVYHCMNAHSHILGEVPVLPSALKERHPGGKVTLTGNYGHHKRVKVEA